MLKVYQIIWEDDAKADFVSWIKTDKLIVKMKIQKVTIQEIMTLYQISQM